MFYFMIALLLKWLNRKAPAQRKPQCLSWSNPPMSSLPERYYIVNFLFFKISMPFKNDLNYAKDLKLHCFVCSIYSNIYLPVHKLINSFQSILIYFQCQLAWENSWVKCQKENLLCFANFGWGRCQIWIRIRWRNCIEETTKESSKD